MSSNSYYGAGGNQQEFTYSNPKASYGLNYGQNQNQNQNQGQYAQAEAHHTYADGSREQKYDSQGNPILPNGERGLLTDLAGAAGGAFLGHKAGGHSILGAIAGGISAHLIGDAVQKPQNPGQYPKPQGQHQGGFGQLFGRRDVDGQAYPEQQQYGGQHQYGNREFSPAQNYEGSYQGGNGHQQHSQHHHTGGHQDYGGQGNQ